MSYQALAELGKAVKTIFLCKYLHSVELRQEINAGLNVVENWNSANSFIFYGKGGEIATNRLSDQEFSCVISAFTPDIFGIYKYFNDSAGFIPTTMDAVDEVGGFAGAFTFNLGSR